MSGHLPHHPELRSLRHRDSMNKHFDFSKLIVILLLSSTTHAQRNSNESHADLVTSTTPQSSSASSLSTSSTTTSTTTTAPAPASEIVGQNFTVHEKTFCTCDLHPFSCDMDCCCDHKCTDKDRKFFVRCRDEDEDKSTNSGQSCYSSSVIHSVSSLNQFVSNPTPKLFCVQISNVKKQDFYANRKQFTSLAELRKIKAKHAYGWHDSITDTRNGGRSQHPFLKSGDVMHLVAREGRGRSLVTREWSLPHSLITGSGLCDSVRPIRFLESVSTSCLRYIFSLEENCQTFLSERMFTGRFVNRRTPPIATQSELQSFTGTGARQSEKSSVSETGDQVRAADDDDEDCLPQHHCLPLRDSASPSIKSHFLSQSQQPACFNAVRKVSHQVFFDTDNGVIRIETHYQRINLTGSRGYLRQFFQVKFTRLPSANAPDNDTDAPALLETVRSGNPGYMMSAPVLAALIPKDNPSNESAAERTPVQRLQLPVLSRADGICSQSAIKIQDVSFGVNFRSSCFMSHQLLVQSERSDDVCSRLQQHMTSILEAERSNVTHVATFGNSNVSRVSEWITIMNDKEWPQVRDASRTAPLSLSRKCPFLVTGFSYEIYFSFTGLIDQPQAKILSVVRRYQSQASVRIPSETSASEFDPEHHVELSTSVSFYDMTHSRRTWLAPAPVLRLQLPADFFYPFFINSSAHPGASLSVFPAAAIVLLFLHGRDSI